MKKQKIFFLMLGLVLVIALAACGSSDKPETGDAAVKEEAQSEVVEQPEAEEPAAESQPEEPAAQPEKVETEFPLLPDAENVLDMQGTIVYQSKTSLEDAFEFYRKELSGKGLKEKEILTLDEEDMFQFVFEGSPNGKQLVVQTLQLDEKTINVTVRYEEPSS